MERGLVDGQKTARTYSSTDCSHVDQVHLVVEVCQSSVDIIKFKPAVHWYVVIIDDCRSQVCTNDFNMGVPASRGHSPGKNESEDEDTIKIFGRKVLTKYHFHTLEVRRSQT